MPLCCSLKGIGRCISRLVSLIPSTYPDYNQITIDGLSEKESGTKTKREIFLFPNSKRNNTWSFSPSLFQVSFVFVFRRLLDFFGLYELSRLCVNGEGRKWSRHLSRKFNWTLSSGLSLFQFEFDIVIRKFGFCREERSKDKCFFL